MQGEGHKVYGESEEADTMITWILKIVNLLLWSILLHEIGHYLYLRSRSSHLVELRFYWHSIRSFGFKVGYPEDYRILSRHQKWELYLAGIVAGLVPIGICSLINIGYSPAVPLYLAGCIQDFKKMWRVIKHGIR